MTEIITLGVIFGFVSIDVDVDVDIDVIVIVDIGWLK